MLAIQNENKILVLKIAQVITFQEYEEVDENNANALHIVSNAGYDQAVAVLLNAKPQFVKAKTSIGYTAMHYASQNGHVKIMEMLLSVNPSIDLTDNGGFTALHIAALNGRCDAIKLLLWITPKIVDVIQDNGLTPLHLAVWGGHYEAVKILLEEVPVLIASIEENGLTALHLAAHNNHVKIIQLLLEFKFELFDLSENNGFTASNIALMRNNNEAINVLESYKTMYDIENGESLVDQKDSEQFIELLASEKSDY